MQTAAANDTASRPFASPETVAARDAYLVYIALNPDPRDPEHLPHLQSLKAAYDRAAMADGTFYWNRAQERLAWAEKDDALAVQYPDWLKYAERAADCRAAAAEDLATVASIMAAPAQQVAA